MPIYQRIADIIEKEDSTLTIAQLEEKVNENEKIPLSTKEILYYLEYIKNNGIWPVK